MLKINSINKIAELMRTDANRKRSQMGLYIAIVYCLVTCLIFPRWKADRLKDGNRYVNINYLFSGFARKS